MPDVEKRLRYFTNQFLQEPDFTDEQAYHRDRQQRHNRTFHTPGIAEGLTVTANVGATEAVVAAGTAVDTAGQQIVLAANRSVTLNTSANRNQWVLLVISYHEETSDPATVGGEGDTRWHENPRVEALPEAGAPPPDTHIRLARLRLDADGRVAERQDDVRVRAGVRVGDELDVRRLRLARPGEDPGRWPVLSSGAANQADVTGALRVTGNANVDGDLNINGRVDGRDVSADGAALDRHLARTDNPHSTTAAQLGVPVSVDGVSNPGGNIDLVPTNAVTITPNNTTKQITVGESHSARADNPHGTTAAQVGAPVSVKGVNNPGGNIDVVQANAITVVADNVAKRLTIGESHSARADNPHGTTAAQVGAPVSVDGVSSPGGNIDLVPANAVTITPNNTTKQITVGESHSARTDNPHGTTAAQVGAIATSGGDIRGTLSVRRVDAAPLVQIGSAGGGTPPEVGVMIQNPSGTQVTGLFVLGTNMTNIIYGDTFFRSFVTFRAGKSGYVIDRCINRSGESLRTGDIVKLKGTPIPRFDGLLNKIPIPEVTLADTEADTAVIGIVDREAPPDRDQPDHRAEAEDPSAVPDGGELYVVTLGTYAHCKVDASEAPIAVGDLLTTSARPGHARKATEPKLGSIIGKALEPLAEGSGYIAVFVNIQ